MTVSPVPAPRDLETLCAEAGALLGRCGADASADARIRDLPDVRTVRYYQTLGLLDRPTTYDGRRALYGRRHLLQVVCVKLLQGQGLSLAQVQATLAGASTAQLEAAVADALARSESRAGEAPARPVVPRREPLPSTPYTTMELAPGLLLTVDLRAVPSPEDIVSRLRAALRGPAVEAPDTSHPPGHPSHPSEGERP